MRKINKNREPKEWTRHRLTSGADYEAIPELRQSLLEEQGYLCAANYNKLINIWDHKDAKGYYNEYCGIVVWFLKQKLKQKV